MHVHVAILQTVFNCVEMCSQHVTVTSFFSKKTQPSSLYGMGVFLARDDNLVTLPYNIASMLRVCSKKHSPLALGLTFHA